MSFSVFQISGIYPNVKGEKDERQKGLISAEKSWEEYKSSRSRMKDIKYLGNNKYQAKVYTEPVQYINDEGKWVDIDTSIKTYANDRQVVSAEVVSGEKDESLFIDEAPYGAIFSTDPGEKITVKGKDYSVSMTNLGATNSPGIVDGNSITYKNVYKNTDLMRTFSGDSIKQDLILKAKGHPTVFEEKIDTGLELKLQEDNSINYYQNDKIVAYTPPINIITATYQTIPVALSYKDKILKITLDINSSITYPAVLDPTLSPNPTLVATDGYTGIASMAAAPTYLYAGNMYDDVGKADQYYRSVIRFNTSAIGSGSTVTAATLNMNYHSNGYGASNAEVHPYSGAWTPPPVYPSLPGKIGDLVLPALGSYTSATISSPNTNINKSGYTMFAIKGTEFSGLSSATGWASYGVSAKQPYLVITYSRPAPGAPTNPGGTALSGTSIRWTWTDATLYEDGYKVHNAAHAVVCTRAVVNSTYCDESGLSANTQYTRHIHAYNAESGDSAATADVSKYTLANVPGDPTATTVSASSINVAINENSNPANTQYQIQETVSGRYVNKTTGALQVAEEWGTYAEFGSGSGINVTGLTANKSYSFKVRARNGDSVVTAYNTNAAVKYTMPVAPNVTPTSATWSSVADVVFTNAAGFGEGGAVYKYVWDQNATWDGVGGTDWNSGTLTKTMVVGDNYLHVKSYSTDGNNPITPVADYGPFQYDNVAPTGTTLNWGAVGGTTLVITAADAADALSGLRGDGLTYYIERDNGATTFVTADANSGWITGEWSQGSLSTNTAYSYRVKARDAAGNQSGWVTPTPVYKYTLVGTPVLNAATNPTNDSRPLISNSSNPDASFANSIVNLYEGANKISQVTANGSGVFTFGDNKATNTTLDTDGNSNGIADNWLTLNTTATSPTYSISTDHSGFSSNHQRISLADVGSANKSALFYQTTAVGSYVGVDRATISAYLYGSSSGVSTRMLIEARDASFAYLGEASLTFTVTATPTKYSLTYDLPANTSYIKGFVLGVYGVDDGDSFDVHIDNAKFDNYYQNLTDASYTNLVAKAVNGDGVEGSASTAVNDPGGIQIDTALPTTNISSAPVAADGDDGYFVTNPIITLSISDPMPSGGNGTTYYKWDDPTFTGPSTYSDPINMSTSIGQGTHTLYYRTIDAVTNAEVLKSQQYKLDSVDPAGTGLTIGDDSGYSQSRYVDLHLSGSDVTSGMATVHLSFDNLLFCSEPFAATISSWDLEETVACGVNLSGDRSRTVYYYFRDSAGNQTATASEVIVQDGVAPSNPTLTVGRSDGAEVDPNLVSSDWYNYDNPKFTWSGAADATAGVSGYWVYFGTDAAADPKIEVDGDNLAYVDNSNSNFYVGTDYTVASALTSGETYYLKVRVQDNALNDSLHSYTESQNEFIYKFDNVKPLDIATLSVDPSGWSSTDSFDFSWAASNDVDSGLRQYTYVRKTTEGVEEYENWDPSGRNIGPGTTTANAITSLYSGVNTFKLIAIDNAGNVSDEITVNYLYAEPVSGPDNVQVDYSQSQDQHVNMLRFYWDEYPGALGYYYSINAAPTMQNSTFVATTSTGFKQFAGVINAQNNIFYVATMDEFGDIGWGNPSQRSFQIDTVAPGIPDALSITDSSNRGSQRWQLTISWDEPDDITPDFDGYVIQRSTDGLFFSDLDTITKREDDTIPNGYLDTNLQNDTTYYYRVRSHDNTGNTSGPSEVVSRMPTGKYTEPPTYTSDPIATADAKALSATISWNTDRTSSSKVIYSASGSPVCPGTGPGSDEQVTAHVVELTGLTPGTTYKYRIQSLDEDRDYTGGDAAACSAELSFETLASPGISDVQISEVGLTSSIITWKTTSSATSKILYGTTSSYGSQYVDNSGSQTTTHTVKINGLNDSTTYNFKIQGTDVDGNVLASDNYVFTTLTYPVISNLNIVQVPNMPTSTIRVTFDSNVPTTSQVVLSGASSKENSTYDFTTSHSVTVTGLRDNSSYTVTAKGRDRYGNEARSLSESYKTDFDTRAPVVKNVTTESEISGFGVDSKGQIVVSWETDEASTSQVEFGIGSTGAYTNKTQEDASLTTSHVVVISDLKSSSPYHFRVISKDASENEGKSDEYAVLTPQANRSIFDAILAALDNAIGWLFRR